MDNGRDERERAYVFPDLSCKKVLVLGLGGGCDIISAYAVAQLLVSSRPETLIYGNTKRSAEECLPFVSPHIRRVLPLRTRKRMPASSLPATAIDHMVPRGDEGCPWIFTLPRVRREANLSEQEIELQGLQSELAAEIRSLKVDFLVGVDTGGDCLANEAVSGPLGRDKQMLKILRETGLPMIYVIVGPGSDGETSYESLVAACAELSDRGQYLGSFPLDPLLPLLRDFSASLARNRTPKIICAAASGELERSQRPGFVVVPRGSRPEIPREWLLQAFVFR